MSGLDVQRVSTIQVPANLNDYDDILEIIGSRNDYTEVDVTAIDLVLDKKPKWVSVEYRPPGQEDVNTEYWYEEECLRYGQNVAQLIQNVPNIIEDLYDESRPLEEFQTVVCADDKFAIRVWVDRAFYKIQFAPQQSQKRRRRLPHIEIICNQKLNASVQTKQSALFRNGERLTVWAETGEIQWKYLSDRGPFSGRNIDAQKHYEGGKYFKTITHCIPTPCDPHLAGLRAAQCYFHREDYKTTGAVTFDTQKMIIECKERVNELDAEIRSLHKQFFKDIEEEHGFEDFAEYQASKTYRDNDKQFRKWNAPKPNKELDELLGRWIDYLFCDHYIVTGEQVADYRLTRLYEQLDPDVKAWQRISMTKMPDKKLIENLQNITRCVNCWIQTVTWYRDDSHTAFLGQGEVFQDRPFATFRPVMSVSTEFFVRGIHLSKCVINDFGGAFPVLLWDNPELNHESEILLLNVKVVRAGKGLTVEQNWPTAFEFKSGFVDICVG